MVLPQIPFNYSFFPHTKRSLWGLGGLLSDYSTCGESMRTNIWIRGTCKSSLCKRPRRGILNASWWGRLEMPAISEFNWEPMTQIVWHSCGWWFLTPNLRSPPTIHMQTWINTSTPYTQVEIIKGNNALKWLLFFVLYFISLFIWTDI